MSPLLVSHSDSAGGAARAATRLHRALVDHGVASRMHVAHKTAGDWRVAGPQSLAQKLSAQIRPRIGALLGRLQKSSNPMPHSLAWLPSNRAHALNRSGADVINLHWINGEMMSVADIGRIDKPVVWTLHDSWPFCGAEHHPADATDCRYIHGYDKQPRSPQDSGLDLDAWVWRRKRKAWRRPFLLVTPSQWLAGCASRSALMSEWPVRVIPNPLPINIYQRWPKAAAQQAFGLPADRKLVLFGAIGGTSRAKGWDLLEPALTRLAAERPDVAGVIVGQTEPSQPPRTGMPLHFLGHLHDDLSMAALYSAVDVVALPSRLENLPQMGTEAQSCGVPVVAFNAGGLPEVVVHRATGYLARAFDPNDLSAGLRWVLQDEPRRMELAQRAFTRAREIWAPDVVAKQYIEVFHLALRLHAQRS